MALRVGTSGWAYKEWVPAFYPPRTSAARMLDYYAEQLATVEAHATYRRLPTPTTVERWRDAVGPSFRYAPKAHLGITHRRELDGVEGRVAAFFAAIAPLGERLGPVLFQLPHRDVDLHRLDGILDALPGDAPPAAFELGPAWWRDDVLGRLDARRATLVLTDSDSGPPPDVVIGAVTYVRLRRQEYDEAAVAAWTNRLRAAAADGRDVYAYVKHDEHGRAPLLARRIAEGATTQ